MVINYARIVIRNVEIIPKHFNESDNLKRKTNFYAILSPVGLTIRDSKVAHLEHVLHVILPSILSLIYFADSLEITSMKQL